MSLEQKIEALTAAVVALTAKIEGASVSAASDTPPSSKGEKQSTGKKYTPEHTIEEMQAALGEVRDRSDAATAKAIIKSVGKADKMNEITDPRLVDATYKAAKAKLEELGAEDEGM